MRRRVDRDAAPISDTVSAIAIVVINGHGKSAFCERFQ
jgi:hypothetical protein